MPILPQHSCGFEQPLASRIAESGVGLPEATKRDANDSCARPRSCKCDRNKRDALRAANLSQTPIGQELAGRAKSDKVSGDYGSGRYSAETLKPAVDSIRYPEVDLSHLYLQT